MICLFVLCAYFIPLPYYVSKPGMAKELEPIIEVDNGTDARGSFMLTTVQMGKANIFTYALAKVVDYWSIYKDDEIRREDETDDEYEMRQLHMMEGSKEDAIISAFREAGKPYKTFYNGIYVYGLVNGMPAADVLKVGDRITKVNEKQLKSSHEFTDDIAKHKQGDFVKLEIIRDKEVLHKSVKLKKIPESGKLGIGIILIDDIEVKTTPHVSINSDQIGGPSAGLMFSLEIYNQLVKEDITKGYEIAGTGTINEKGEVGAIGGIDQKIVAASESGAEIFFAPNENGSKDSNYVIAKKTAEDIKTKMKIVPVDTMEDALNYLKKLKEK
ncbi:SepM family pheromone-processing serine protease [Bacillus massiliigorillae]|uniref:SepM family pheromone-processing serine protease n=1 Tax=Bacillus massiliigorillae TaxID=1243664 RepID=UPI002350562A|nr:SepM family pheromone-processing serine protease [Bacillus massiliigorillae]